MEGFSLKSWLLCSLLLIFVHTASASNLLLAKQAEQLPRLVIYDSSYRQISYPNGDVPEQYGVCSDVFVRSYRKIGIDLQKLVHEDMKANFRDYPSQRIWGLRKPDTNIDHRRVPNLEVFFSRRGKTKPISKNINDYVPGDIVSWRLDNGRPHIGIVTSTKSPNTQNYLVMHNIGYGQIAEDILFRWPVIGHYSY